jgi:hypothetical protein
MKWQSITRTETKPEISTLRMWCGRGTQMSLPREEKWHSDITHSLHPDFLGYDIIKYTSCLPEFLQNVGDHGNHLPPYMYKTILRHFGSRNGNCKDYCLLVWDAVVWQKLTDASNGPAPKLDQYLPQRTASHSSRQYTRSKTNLMVTII